MAQDDRFAVLSKRIVDDISTEQLWALGSFMQIPHLWKIRCAETLEDVLPITAACKGFACAAGWLHRSKMRDHSDLPYDFDLYSCACNSKNARHALPGQLA